MTWNGFGKLHIMVLWVVLECITMAARWRYRDYGLFFAGWVLDLYCRLIMRMCWKVPMTLYYSLPLFCLRHTYHLAVMDRLIQPFLVCPSSSYRPQEVKHCGYIPAKQNCLFVCARLIHCLYFLLHHYCVWVFFLWM